MANMTPKPFKYPFSGHSYAMRATLQPRLHCKGSRKSCVAVIAISPSIRCVITLAAAATSLHNILTDTSAHLKRVRSGLLSPDRDGYHRSGKAMKERCGSPLVKRNLFRIEEPHYLCNI